ncbi:cob(I)yrinic acid a,c-diamide adenosyltransferase, partial [Candidatus Nomurabacteria bacterium]|nr:cob(I)yrinic acid a,c-diamide adenosyltransferase [Candidatus Nomurabacteria bacterium]
MEKMTGLIHIYCGEGKGKTTAALGLIVRASGAGYDVVIVQYFKSWDTSELR